MKRAHNHRFEPVPERCFRRRVLLACGAAGTAVVAGCLSEDRESDEPVEPLDLTGRQCVQCGMVIGDHYGPNSQVFYADGMPDDHEGPAHFETVSELVVYHDEKTTRGWETRAVFVTDYSIVDYDLVEIDGEVHISTHPEAEAFTDATDVHYVVGSDVLGSMNEDFIPFSDRGDADAFSTDHGGDLRGWEELSPEDIFL